MCRLTNQELPTDFDGRDKYKFMIRCLQHRAMKYIHNEMYVFFYFTENELFLVHKEALVSHQFSPC